MKRFLSKHKTTILVVCIILFAALLRLWQLGHVPPSPDWDEASYGYNAYSMIQTGKDEYGAAFPVVLRSFDDYKPALYLYIVIPVVSILGVTTEAVRLPSATIGILTVLLTYYLIKVLFKRTDLALVTAFLLAISPWHIQFSRIAFEANVGLFLNMAMVYTFLRGLKHPRLLPLSAILGGLSIYAYQSEKVFTPLLAAVLILVYFRDIRKISLRYIVLTIFVGLLVVFPMGLYLLTNNQALTRARETSIFADKSNLTKNIQRLDVDTKNNDYLGLLLDNRRIFYGTKIIEGYISHFSFTWLFILGDNPRHHAPFMGLLYLFELPFLLIGIYQAIFLPFDKRAKLFVCIWFLLAPIPASITSGVPHAVRTINFLPLFQFFTALGILSSISFISLRLPVPHKRLLAVKYSILCIGAVIFLFNVLYYLNQYFVQYNKFASKDWQYGYEDAVNYTSRISNQYDKIIVTNKDPMDQSYIFFLYYLKYNPAEYHAELQRNSSGGFAEEHAFGKFEFRPIDWTKEEKDEKILYIGRPADFPDNQKSLQTFRYLDGTEAIKIVEGK